MAHRHRKHADRSSDWRQERNGLYGERNALVAALSKRFPAHLMIDPTAEGPWATLVCIHLPTGTATWHIAAWNLSLFAHLAYAPYHWDGHTTDEKYERLSALELIAATEATP